MPIIMALSLEYINIKIIKKFTIKSNFPEDDLDSGYFVPLKITAIIKFVYDNILNRYIYKGFFKLM